MHWRDRLRYDLVPPLRDSGDAAVAYFAERDLLGAPVAAVQNLWALPAPSKLLRRQRQDGSWTVGAARARRSPAVNYALLETWKHLARLVDQYGFDRTHPGAAAAAAYLFSCQTDEGDFRGILANQLAMYYSGAILALLIRAGYADDARIERGLQWLLRMRQDDGGWVATVFQTLDLSGADTRRLTSTDVPTLREHDRARPFSHNWTGMVLRAFAAHPRHRHTPPVVHAARLLTSRLFRPDVYASYRHPDNWVRFQVPFWWNHLVAALDTLSLIGLPADDPGIAAALDWLVEHQEATGLWRTSYSSIHKRPPDTPRTQTERLWVSLAIGRVFARFHAATD